MLGEKLMTLRKKHGYSQQELADLLSVTRQTISNWECDQGSPSLDKAQMLAEIYRISLDDLAGNNVEVAVHEKEKSDGHILKKLIGQTVQLDCSNIDLLLDGGLNKPVKVLDVNKEWLRVEYVRPKDDWLFKKEKESVIKLIELSAINGFRIVEGSV